MVLIGGLVDLVVVLIVLWFSGVCFGFAYVGAFSWCCRFLGLLIVVCVLDCGALFWVLCWCLVSYAAAGLVCFDLRCDLVVVYVVFVWLFVLVVGIC